MKHHTTAVHRVLSSVRMASLRMQAVRAVVLIALLANLVSLVACRSPTVEGTVVAEGQVMGGGQPSQSYVKVKLDDGQVVTAWVPQKPKWHDEHGFARPPRVGKRAKIRFDRSEDRWHLVCCPGIGARGYVPPPRKG